MGNWFSENVKQLTEYLFSRRKKKHADDTDSNYSQDSSSNENLSADNAAQQSNSSLVLETMTNISQEATTTNTIVLQTQSSNASPNLCSEFYIACRNNQIDKVKELRENLTLDQIDKIEPNGSTALHAASYYSHHDIVKFLLETGADRSVLNKYKNLAFDEASKPEIKELFLRTPDSTRVVSDTGAIEWELVDEDVLEKTNGRRRNIKSTYETTNVQKMFDRIEKNYIGKDLANFPGIEKIRRFFQRAAQEQDPVWIIKAYTAETAFYKVLNKEIAVGTTKHLDELWYIIGLLSYHPTLDKFIYTGYCYRVMKITDHDLEKIYQVNTSFMTKSFLSSSIEEKIALCFLCRQELERKETGKLERYKSDGSLIKQWILCVYHVKHNRTALNIDEISQYVMEGEILIMPYTVFQIKTKAIINVPSASGTHSITKIELEECDL